MDLRKNDKVFFEGAIIRVESFYANNRLVEGAEFDLSLPEFDPYRGKILRVWVDNDYNLTTKRNPSQVWLLIEIPVPRRQYNQVETEELDEQENPVMEQVEIPMKIEEIDCKIFPLPPAR